MNIKTDWTCGNIAIVASMVLPDELPAYVARFFRGGLTQELQRSPSGEWETNEVILLGDAIEQWETNDKGTPVRPKGFKRNSIPYSAASAERLEASFTTALRNDAQYVSFSMNENVGGTATSRKNAEAFIGKLGEDTVRELLTNLGMKCDSYEELVEAAHKQFFGKK